MNFDPRLTPARADLAARQLEGQVTAERFVEGEVFEVLDPIAPLRRGPSPDAALDTEALMGERVSIYETTEEGWSWGQLQSDGYVGWLPTNALGRPRAAATHKVAVPRTLMFPGPSIKLPPLAGLPFGARLAITRQDGALAVTASGGFVPTRHLAPLDAYESDFVAVAERLLGAPYLWGGKSGLGIDCSGLVQVSLAACGIACRRDSDMQELDFPLAQGERRRGDLLFWKGHVAIARDAATIIHANAFHMAVTIEPATDAIARAQANGSEVTSVRRPVA